MENKDINHPIWGYHISGNPYMRIYIVYLDIWKPWHKQFHTMCIAGCVYNISYCTRNNVWKTSNPISHDPSSFSPFQWPVWGILSLRQNQILYYCWYIYIYLVGGWPTPLKNMKVRRDDYSHILWKIKNVWNHQPVFGVLWFHHNCNHNES